MRRPYPLFASVVVLGLAGASAVCTAIDDAPTEAVSYPHTDGPLGYGIFQKLHAQHYERQPTVNIESPYVAGVECMVNWADVEPQEGVYRWEAFDRIIGPWQRAGKKVIIGVRTVSKSGKTATSASATPPWVFAAGAQKLTSPRGGGGRRRRGVAGEEMQRPRRRARAKGDDDAMVNWPVYWDPVYFAKYQQFIQAFARRYDGHPAVEFVEIGLGQFGSTKIAGNAQTLRMYEQAGYTEERWTATIKQIVAMYDAAFAKTPTCVILSPYHKARAAPNWAGVEDVAQYAAAKGVYLYNHSLAGTDEYVRDNPFPAIFSRVRGQTKTALGPDNPMRASNPRNDERYGAIRPAVEHAIGGVRGLPATGISYLIFYVDDISAANPRSRAHQRAFEDALRWGLDRLGRP